MLTEMNVPETDTAEVTPAGEADVFVPPTEEECDAMGDVFLSMVDHAGQLSTVETMKKHADVLRRIVGRWYHHYDKMFEAVGLKGHNFGNIAQAAAAATTIEYTEKFNMWNVRIWWDEPFVDGRERATCFIMPRLAKPAEAAGEGEEPTASNIVLAVEADITTTGDHHRPMFVLGRRRYIPSSVTALTTGEQGQLDTYQYGCFVGNAFFIV